MTRHSLQTAFPDHDAAIHCWFAATVGRVEIDFDDFDRDTASWRHGRHTLTVTRSVLEGILPEDLIAFLQRRRIHTLLASPPHRAVIMQKDGIVVVAPPSFAGADA